MNLANVAGVLKPAKPDGKAKGKTVVAVTHDERFWHLADRVIRFDLGTIAWERAGSELQRER